MSSYNFGITPAFSFDDVEGILAGETITLCGHAYDFTTDPIVLSPGKLNGLIADVSNSGSGPQITTATPPGEAVTASDLTIPNGLIDALKAMATGSAKATIAKAITGNPLGDIGELENDTTFDELVNGEQLKAVIANSISVDAVISVAEDIIRNQGLSNISEGGRDTSNPFKSDDELVFNMLVTNGTITLTIDSATDLEDTSNGVAFFTDPVKRLDIGTSEQFTAEESAGVVINNDGNVYAEGANRYAANTLKVSTSDAGYVEPDSGKEGVLIKLKITLSDVVVPPPE